MVLIVLQYNYLGSAVDYNQTVEFFTFEPIRSNNIRRHCSPTNFFQDGVYEDTESYALELALETFTTDILVSQSVTEVFLLDQDSKQSLLGLDLGFSTLTLLRIIGNLTINFSDWSLSQISMTCYYCIT